MQKRIVRYVASLCAALALLFINNGRGDAAVTVLVDPGTTNITTALTGFATEGDDMAGMTATAFFDDGTSEMLSWAATGAGAGGVTGTKGSGWSLSVSGDTFLDDAWELINSSGFGILRLVLDGAPGMTVFDRDIFPSTPGSVEGTDFAATTPLNIEATYRNFVALQGNPPEEDIFRELDIVFTDQGGFPTGAAAPNVLLFSADTDNATTEIRMPPPMNGEVPEPASIAVWSLLFAGIGLTAYRRKR